MIKIAIHDVTCKSFYCLSNTAVYHRVISIMVLHSTNTNTGNRHQGQNNGRAVPVSLMTSLGS